MLNVSLWAVGIYQWFIWLPVVRMFFVFGVLEARMFNCWLSALDSASSSYPAVVFGER